MSTDRMPKMEGYAKYCGYIEVNFEYSLEVF